MNFRPRKLYFPFCSDYQFNVALCFNTNVPSFHDYIFDTETYIFYKICHNHFYPSENIYLYFRMEDLFLKIALCDTDEKFELIVNRHLVKIIEAIQTDQKKALEATVQI